MIHEQMVVLNLIVVVFLVFILINRNCNIYIWFDLIYIPVYENRPDGLLRGRNELIVLALRCNAVDGVIAAAFCSYCVNDDVLLFSRIPWRGDDGHDDVWRFDDPWFIDSRDRDVFDFLRKIPALLSVLQRPFFYNFESNWCQN